MEWSLPTSVNVAGVEYKVRTDYRAILDILVALNDPNYEDDEKAEIALIIFYQDYDTIPPSVLNEAMEQLAKFIDCGLPEENKVKPKLMDWEQDAPIIIPAINRVLGKEVRSVEYMHWWTFMGAYMEIGEGTFSTVVGIRYKNAKRQKLDKWEKQYLRENPGIVNLKTRLTDEEEAEKKALLEMLDA